MMLEEVSVGTVCVCLWLGVREAGSMASLEVKVGKLSEKKEREKRVCGDSGYIGRPRENKTGTGWKGFARTTEKTLY
jgi:hypothetical protein